MARAGARRWDPLLVFLALYVATAVGRVHQLFTPLARLHPDILAVAGVVLLFLLDRSPERRTWPVVRSYPGRFLLALVAWMALATPFALTAGTAVRTLVGFAETAAVAVILAVSVRDFGDLERLAGVFFAVVALYAAVVLVRFRGTGRLGGLYFYDGNDFATVVAMTVPLGLYFVTTASGTGRRVAAGLGLALMAAAFARSESRGGLLALVAAMAFLLARPSAMPRRWRAAVAAGGALAIGVMVTGAFWKRMSTVMNPQQDYNLTGEFGRLDVWKRGLGYMERRPLLGVGPGNFAEAEGEFAAVVRQREEVSRGAKWSAPHDIYVQVGAELGVPGLLLFVGVLWTGFAAAARRVPGVSGPAASLGPALAAGLVGFAVGGAFLSLAYADAPYMLLGLALGRRRLLRESAAARVAAAPAEEGFAWSR